jgi:hypothetical protein
MTVFARIIILEDGVRQLAGVYADREKAFRPLPADAALLFGIVRVEVEEIEVQP